MKRNTFIAGIIIIFLILIAVTIKLGGASKAEPQPSVTATSSPSAQEELLLENKIIAFGKVLKNVSLLSPAATLKSDIEKNYSSYITPELLATWQAEPTLALGRNVSSPWPDRIEINSIIKQNATTYKVLGNVIEITSADNAGRPAGVYPVTLFIEKRGEDWKIAGVEKGPYSELPKETSLTGFWECLPHKDTSGPQTLECAFGLMADSTGKHYALDMSSLGDRALNFPLKSHMKVQGVLVPANQLNTDMWQKYNMEGIIHVTKLQKID